jgi:GTP diphosphokinase / guanosine-3',5'-bis(diphosphate) 3'-diphosphatase
MRRIGLGKINDRALMEALVPGFDVNGIALDFPGQEHAISIRGLTPGLGYHLGRLLPPHPGRPDCWITFAGPAS